MSCKAEKNTEEMKNKKTPLAIYFDKWVFLTFYAILH